MKTLIAKKLIKILEQNGYILFRQKGSHHIFKNEENIMVVVPIHGKNNPLKIGTFLKIIKQSGLSKEIFTKK